MTVRRFEISTAAGGYAVHIGPGALDALGEVTLRAVVGSAVAVVTDTNVEALYGERVMDALGRVGLRAEKVVVPPGETSKSWERAGAVLDALARAGLTREDAVVALGGGVVGDLAGFCAAAYMRGVPVVQVPTTLLAQVDSAIGGKTAVDLPAGKNLAGAFWQPAAVVGDTSCLATLPDIEWGSGLAEVVKSAALDGESAFAGLERDSGALMDREIHAVEEAVWMAAGLKARVVSADEREAGARECLNYGHTLGHAIEVVAGFGTVPHGAAVAEGMRFAAALAEKALGADAAWSRRQDALLARLGSPRMGCGYAPGVLLAAMSGDKKVRMGEVRFVLCEAPGSWTVRPVPSDVLSAELSAWCGE